MSRALVSSFVCGKEHSLGGQETKRSPRLASPLLGVSGDLTVCQVPGNM